MSDGARSLEEIRRPERTGYLAASRAGIGVCFLAALFEGLDIVAAGLVAPRLVPAFGLSPSAAGWLFSSSTIGLLIGAVFGGWIADRVGRKRVLIASMTVFGAMSLLTAVSTGPVALFASRFATGLGLGGAMPNLIALSAEAGPASRRATLVTLMYSGVPLGGALGGAVTLWGGAMENWRRLFLLGGFGPLVVALLLGLLLSESRLFQQSRSTGVPHGRRIFEKLFGGPNAITTVLIWATFFCTLVILYLLINWLPLLLVGNGYSRPDAALTSILFNIGGGAGAIVLGWLMDRRARTAVIVAAYLGMAVSLLSLSLTFRISGVALPVVILVAFLVGFFVIGAQLVLYGVAPSFYETSVRATGLGAAVAAGRAGSIVGPLIAGQMLGSGNNAAAVVTALLPIVAVAGTGAVLLILRPMTGRE